ncbi:MAG: tetratricopeptide repeat protein [Bacteroidota bacterium]
MKKIIIILSLTLLIGCEGSDYYNLGVYQEKQGNLEKAIYYYSKAIEQNPNDNEAYFNRAHSQQVIGGKEQNVIFDYSQSLKFNPNDNEAHMNRGVAYMKIGKYEEAISDYKKSIEIKPDYPLIYANLGNVYKLKNDNESACLNWKKSLSLGNIEVKRKLAQNCK